MQAADKKDTFEEIFQQNERRIHFHIHKLKIRDPHHEFYQEGLCALWNAYENYKPDKGSMATYFNYVIRNRLIDMIRKQTREVELMERMSHQKMTELEDGNHVKKHDTSYPLFNMPEMNIADPRLWQQLKVQLTQNQWKWVLFHIIGDMPIKDIAIQENTTVEAVKSWGKQVRRKLRNSMYYEQLSWDL
ncbi:RNA polymerase sigma factor [Virgibacillus byunsanensis]|uniref:RNA polymerase sigma factor n=1 Tax=Virgibacillus byunsanensis TaxID=570945 RepID=A0ABW3LRT8_9BACI